MLPPARIWPRFFQCRWSIKSGDTLFRDYRREYKKRFARMKVGKLTPEDYAACLLVLLCL